MAVLVANPWAKAFAIASALAAMAAIAGFLGFLVRIDRLRDRTPVRSDAIVVFTGEPQRIAVGVRHLADGYARRMLVSGTELSAGTDTAAVMAQVTRDHPAWFACCIDLDPGARTTSDNARDVARWARTHGLTSLILVTADDHMPRAKLELECALPGAQVAPHPLVTGIATPGGLWRHPNAFRRVGGEFGKFVLAWLRMRLRGCAAGAAAEESSLRR
jgi:uncharacterized SAM-binding protein YcdF (DUF218 family)